MTACGCAVRGERWDEGVDGGGPGCGSGKSVAFPESPSHVGNVPRVDGGFTGGFSRGSSRLGRDGRCVDGYAPWRILEIGPLYTPTTKSRGLLMVAVLVLVGLQATVAVKAQQYPSTAPVTGAANAPSTLRRRRSRSAPWRPSSRSSAGVLRRPLRFHELAQWRESEPRPRRGRA